MFNEPQHNTPGQTSNYQISEHQQLKMETQSDKSLPKTGLFYQIDHQRNLILSQKTIITI